MATQTVMFKIGATQSAILPGLAGKSYVASKISSAGTGMGKLLYLTPVAAGGKSVALKLEGTRQIAEISGLVGKTFTVGNSPTVVGGTSSWLVLAPSGSAAATGAAVGGAAVKGKTAASTSMLMKLEGTKQAAQIPAMAGKSFTVIKSPVLGAKASNWLFLKPATGVVQSKDLVALQIQNGTGNLSGMVGKSYTMAKAPMVAGNGAGNWVLFQPANGAVAKAAAGAAVATKTKAAASTAKVAKTAEAAKTAKVAVTVKEAGVVAKSGAALSSNSTVAATSGSSGVVWNGTGWKLGLGLGMGGWGPVLMLGVLAATSVGAYSYLKRKNEAGETF
ncbi:MAG: hypothetical protein HQL70_09045 [Magnetococcales bacterium]|nr:hypothetical protein [Magnetococcales bacterium]